MHGFRTLALALAIGGFLAHSTAAVRAESTTHPWCMTFKGFCSGGPVCMFRTYQQCKAHAGGLCVANPAMNPLPQAPADGNGSGHDAIAAGVEPLSLNGTARAGKQACRGCRML